MSLRTTDAVKDDACNSIVDKVDIGAGANGTLEVWSGSRPATLGDAPAGDLLAEFDFAATAFGASGAGANPAGVASAASTPIASTGLDDGTIGFVVVKDQDGAVLWDDNDVGTSGTAVVFNTLTVSTGVDITLVSYDFSVSDPA